MVFGSVWCPFFFPQFEHLFLIANIVTTSKALVTSSDALVSNSFSQPPRVLDRPAGFFSARSERTKGSFSTR